MVELFHDGTILAATWIYDFKFYSNFTVMTKTFLVGLEWGKGLNLIYMWEMKQ